MRSREESHLERLSTIVHNSAWFLRALKEVRALELTSWCIGAGAVRNLVWDHLHDFRAPSFLPDVDVAYFDDENLDSKHEQDLQAKLETRAPDVPWEVTNQASVHLWFEHHFGHAVQPVKSLDDAISTWPEFATCVGVTLLADDSLDFFAPYGLEDLFGIRVRRNPARVSLATYRERVARKKYANRWPKVQVLEA